ncbi:GFA family protein [Aliikangiella maris]|uniref:GFA family protein n=2 Tax=Aliikangiella maris TaxID=3162458 RepID=A0ABV2BZ25_9GAMM
MNGGCLCGRVTFQITTFSPFLSHCHCSMCRKFHGAAFATYGTVQEENIVFSIRDDALKIYQSSYIARRGFCCYCGSSIYYQFLSAPEKFDIALGTLNDEPDLNVAAHIFYDSKPKWSGEFNDPLPKYREEHDLAK